MVGLEWPPVPPGRIGAAVHLAERKAGCVALADGGADARGARAASGEAHTSLASESDAAGAEEEDGDGRGSCAAARARRPSMATLPCPALPREAEGDSFVRGSWMPLALASCPGLSAAPSFVDRKIFMG